GEGGPFGVDSQVAVEGGQHFLEMDRPVLGGFSQAGRGADDLPRAKVSPAQEGAGYSRPVIPSGGSVDAGAAAELSPDDDRAIPFEPALVQVRQQGGNPPIEMRH